MRAVISTILKMNIQVTCLVASWIAATSREGFRAILEQSGRLPKIRGFARCLS